MAIAAQFETLAETTEREPGRAPRRKLLLETLGATAAGVATDVVVHNFSETGMLLECGEALVPGDVIEVDLPHIGVVAASVVWSSGRLHGCAFAEPLAPAALSAAQLRSAVRKEVDLSPAPSALGGAAFAERLMRLRKDRGLTQGELAARLGVSKPTVWAWEQGRARPIEERLDAIAEVLGTTVADLRPARAIPGLTELVNQCKAQIAQVVETTPDKIRIMIDL